MTEPALPELHQGNLDADALRALFQQLAAVAEVGGVLINGRPAAGGSGEVTLSEALDLLLAGSVRGVQVRYRFEGSHWVDTVMPGTDGFRLVRMALGGGQATG